MTFATYNDIPPYRGKENEAYYDRGLGVPKLNEQNMTIQDIYRTPFLFIQDHRKNYKNLMSTALKGIQSESELSKLFFSDRNIKRLQKMIKQDVFKRTNGEFRLDVDQELRDLFIAMRAVYLEYGRFKPKFIVRQAKWLNQKVLEEIVPGIVTEIRQYYGYLKEINGPLKPIIRPLNVNNAGRLTLPSFTTTFGY